MIGHEFEAQSGEELVHFVRALGTHRYVSSRLHLIHAFVVMACAQANESDLAEAVAWAREVLSNPDIDADSKDERLYRRASDAELVAVLRMFWTRGDHRDRACAWLVERLAELGVDTTSGNRLPFDESYEADVFPVLIDAGWELLPLARLTPDRHKGALDAFGDAFAFEVAKFEEENAVPPMVTLHELPVMGSVELLHAFDDEGTLRAPFVLWASGHETYLDYVLRGVTRAVENRMARQSP